MGERDLNNLRSENGLRLLNCDYRGQLLLQEVQVDEL